MVMRVKTDGPLSCRLGSGATVGTAGVMSPTVHPETRRGKGASPYQQLGRPSPSPNSRAKWDAATLSAPKRSGMIELFRWPSIQP